MPVQWTLDGDILTLVFDGEYTFEEIAGAAEAGLAAIPGRIRLLVDATGTARLPDSHGVQQRIGLLHRVGDRLAGPVAIVATAGAMYGVARQIAQQGAFNEAVTIRVFESRAEAAEWLALGPGQADG